MNPTPVQAVTFDCWGTLITDGGFSDSMAARVNALAEAGNLDEQAAADLMERAWRLHHEAWLDTRQYGSEGMARFCLKELAITDREVCDRLTQALEEAGRLGSQRALEGAVDTLRTLRESGIRTALVCDAGFTPGRIVREFLEEHGLLEHLEYCAFSNEVGVPKPNPKIFHAALEAIDVPPGRAIHVGDLLRTDIFGARQLGMRTVRITDVDDDAQRGFSWNPDAQLDGPAPSGSMTHPYGEADEVVASHAELLPALQRLGAPVTTVDAD